MDTAILSITAPRTGRAKREAMKSILRLLVTGLLTGVLLFCVFGFMATYEPMPTVTRWTWRAIYSLAGFSTLAGMAFTWRRGWRKEVA